ncbi:hypothetical protein [Mannheimia haemolytica]|uniref:hypothetical protein n=1 Tax=Mannheimia haemolytica TaxID=75985 RepID=UPI001F29A637|nr:hypothetical protein [Mannheimia haemolytica]
MRKSTQKALYQENLATIRHLLDKADKRLAEGKLDRMLMNVKAIQELALEIIEEAEGCNMRKSTTPSHIALTIEQAGKLNQSINYAQAILTLIQHNESATINDDDPDEFFTSTGTIKTAISAVQHFLNVAEENSKGVYLSLEVNNG